MKIKDIIQHLKLNKDKELSLEEKLRKAYGNKKELVEICKNVLTGVEQVNGIVTVEQYMGKEEFTEILVNATEDDIIAIYQHIGIDRLGIYVNKANWYLVKNNFNVDGVINVTYKFYELIKKENVDMKYCHYSPIDRLHESVYNTILKTNPLLDNLDDDTRKCLDKLNGFYIMINLKSNPFFKEF